MNNDKALAADVAALLNRMRYHIDESGCHYTDDAACRILEAALATDAPIVEGLDESIEWVASWITDQETGELKPDSPATPCVQAARLYAQGRTQSAVPVLLDGTQPDLALVKFKGEDIPASVALVYYDGWNLGDPRDWPDAPVYYPSAAPPVTGGAWLPIESAPKDGTRFIGYSRSGGVVRRDVSWNENRQDFDVGFTCLSRDYTHWQPQQELPVPPSSAEKEGV